MEIVQGSITHSSPRSIGKLILIKLLYQSSFNRRVDVSVLAMSKLLWEVKGGGHGQAISKQEVTQAADAVLQPLMDLLDGESC